MGAARIWVMAARVRTLPASVAPVLVGTALGIHEGTFRAGAFAAALLGAIFIQVGTNLSNDYSDARRGADAEDRLGPVRVTAGGLVPPRRVLLATYITFGLAVLCGAYLVAVAGPGLIAVGAASILAGVLYTGGPRPYGYEGLGELFVFLFFGIVAVTGSYYVQVEHLEWEAFALAVPVGLLAAAILVVNNVRDIDSDRRAGKRTLAVRLGRDRARRLYARDGRARLPQRPGAMARRATVRLGAPALAHRAARCRAAARGCDPQRRPLPECRARPDGPVAAALLPAAGRRSGREPVKVEVREQRLRFARPVATAYGAPLHERHILIVTLTAGDGVKGFGEAAPLEPYDGISLAEVREALAACESVLESAPDDATPARSWLSAARLVTFRRRWPPSTSPSGTWPVVAPGGPSRRSSPNPPRRRSRSTRVSPRARRGRPRTRRRKPHGRGSARSS